MYIEEVFPHLDAGQKETFSRMAELYKTWNEHINVVSRRDIDNIELHHLLHSLAIARFIDFKDDSNVLDLGTGGGLPGLPLAVVMPNVHFHLIDRIGKKIKVAKDIANELGLKNVTFQHGDLGECHDKFDFIVSRGVMPQNDMWKIAKRNISAQNRNAIPNGLISLKGGDLADELKGIEKQTEIIPVSAFFPEPYFETKKIVYTR